MDPENSEMLEKEIPTRKYPDKGHKENLSAKFWNCQIESSEEFQFEESEEFTQAKTQSEIRSHTDEDPVQRFTTQYERQN